jgi:hypothetical protein
MPSLIVSSRFTTDSQILRRTAEQLGWGTLRLEGRRIPDWFECDDGQIALFYTAPHANRGWAVVEFNECWACGIYACDPEKFSPPCCGLVFPRIG